MLGTDTVARLKQIRMDELCGKYAHLARYNRLRRWGTVVDGLAIIVPILYFAPRLLAAGSPEEKVVQAIDTLLSVVLLALTVLKLLLRWDDEKQAHLTCIEKNSRLAAEASSLLVDANATEGSAAGFIRSASAPDRAETELLAGVDAEQKRRCYREGLKEFTPGSRDAHCPVCRASVFVFKPGECQVCGNSAAPSVIGGG
jgi:mobilome CxxCx(11)CxxC protein